MIHASRREKSGSAEVHQQDADLIRRVRDSCRRSVIPIPENVSFADAVTIPIQGVTGYLLVKEVARVQPFETVLIQAAAGGVGSYLVQLAKLAGAGTVIALVGSHDKASFVRQLGADVVISSNERWADEVLARTNGRGVDVVFESASGKLRNQSYELLASSGRVIVYGARNVNDKLSPKQIQQLIFKNQTIIGFNIPSFDSKRIAAAVPQLMQLISAGRLKLFALSRFPLHRVRDAFKALASRRTVGKIVLVPNLLD
jgi:NADPH2:quinone reductase